MLQIQFLDKNVVDAMVPAVSLEPKHVIFIYDRRSMTERHVKNVTRAINEKLPDTIIGAVQTDMFSISEIKETILSCIKDFKNENVCIDITGGTELMTASGLLMHKEYGIQVTYTNLSKGYMYDVATEEKIVDVKHITADDYLLAIGAKHFTRSHSMPKEKEYDDICAIAEYLFEHLGEWHSLHKYLSEHYGDSSTLEFSVTTELEYAGHAYKSEKALEIFITHGFAEKLSHNKYKFKNNRAREYMTIFGVWLEMYIYIKSLEFFEETHLGYIIDWNNSDAEDTIDNEIDVLVLKKSIPIFISCKMRKPDAMDVYEVGYLADRMGGPNAKGIIATTYKVSADKNLSKGVFQRLKKMNVGFIETDSFKTHTPSQIFNTAMQGAE